MREDALTSAVQDLREVVEDLRSELAYLREPRPAPDVELLNLTALAQVLGVSDRTLRRLRKRRGFPRPIRGSGRLRWRIGDIARWLEGR